MSVTFKLGDVGLRFNIYYKTPAREKLVTSGTLTTSNNTYTKVAYGSVTLPVNSRVTSFYNQVACEYSFQHGPSSSSNAQPSTYLVFNGSQTSTYTTSGLTYPNLASVSDTKFITIPSDGVVNWELWLKSSSSGNPVKVVDLKIYFGLYSTNSTITASQLGGQLYITGYRLNTGSAFYLDDDGLFTFTNYSDAVLEEIFDSPIKVAKITFLGEPAIIYALLL